MENEREKLIYLAKLACRAERYDDTIKSMRKVCEYDIELSKEEIDLLTTGYKEVMLAKRDSLKVISTIGEMENLKGNEQKVKLIKGKQEMVKDEFFNVCNDILFLIDAHLIPSTTNVESIIFFHRMKGDYYRYMAEFGSDAERKETAENSLEAYKVAMEMAENSLAPTNLVRLGLALNFSVFSYDILNSTERAYKLAKQAYDEAVAELDGLDDKQTYKEKKVIINMLKDNLSVWTSDHDDDTCLVCSENHFSSDSRKKNEHNSGIPKNKKDE